MDSQELNMTSQDFRQHNENETFLIMLREHTSIWNTSDPRHVNFKYNQKLESMAGRMDCTGKQLFYSPHLVTHK